MVDDGSTDSTGVLCDELAGKDERLRVYHSENHGVSRARNIGLSNANGEYVIFIDPDDILLPNALQVAHDAIEQYNADAVRYNYVALDANGRQSWTMNGSMREGVYEKYEIVDNFLCAYIGTSAKDIFEYGTPNFWSKREFGAVWRFMYKRKKLIDWNIQFDEQLKLNEDSMFNCLFFCHAEKIVVIHDVLYQYFIRNAGAMTSILYNTNTLIDQKIKILRCRKYIREVFCEKNGGDLMPKYAGSVFMSVVEMIVKSSMDINNWKYIKTYLQDREVRTCLGICKWDGSFKNVRILLLLFTIKHNLTFFIFMFLCVLNKAGMNTSKMV